MTTSSWKPGVLYQIYPRSFADTTGSGVGDLRGVIEHLDHLAWLGIDGIWLTPIGISPNVDFGYDVADYCDVQPEFGTLADVDELIEKAAHHGIRVMLDLVPNHTSDQHPWFVDARSSRAAEHRDWYVWHDCDPQGAPPNNWVSCFGGSAWEFDPVSEQAYLHNFATAQPDLNWWNEEVRSAFDTIQRFWFDRGVAGFRIDMCNMVIKDAALRDNPPASPGDGMLAELLGQKFVYNGNRPEIHEVVRRWRTLADSYDPPRVLFGETVVNDLDALARFYGDGNDELHLALNVPFQETSFDAHAMPAVVDATLDAYPVGALPLWAGSNHDIPRMATHWGEGDADKTRAALLMLLTLPGTALLYQGDEIGLPDTTLQFEDVIDPVGHWLWPNHPGRDPARTPMPWSDEPGGGFTAPGVKPWLPFGDLKLHNVKDQRDDPHSTLTLTRDLIAMRRDSPDLRNSGYSRLDAPKDVWTYRRGDHTVVALNLSDAEVRLDIMPGLICLGTDRLRDGEHVADRIDLAPWEAVVISVDRAPTP